VIVTFVFTDEQKELRRTVRRFLAEKSGADDVRRVVEGDQGFDRQAWRQLAEQLGLTGLCIPEQYGGAGQSFAELAIVFEEMGRALFCAPYFSTVAMATTLLLTVDDEAARQDYLPGIATGRTIATVALAEPGGGWDESGIVLPATRGDDGWHLDGEKSYVLDGHVADLVLVPARTPGGVSIFAVHGDAPGLTARPVDALDQTRALASLSFTSVTARLVGPLGNGWPAVAHMLDLAAIALAAEQVGGAQRVLDMAVDYAKLRLQFGRPIGSFQAVKHKCTDVLVALESAKSAAYYAAWMAATGAADVPVLASLAKACCSEAYFQAAAENIQIHGGIGYTWEHPAHLYFRRAKSSELLFGDASYHRELLAQRIGI
jgi:alkylation response protein AidB-like acyl-CoA dehydrogenase